MAITDPLWQHVFRHTNKLQQAGCINVARVPEPTLDNEIHPIFAYKRWMSGYGQELLPEIYARVQPALKLASMFLNEPSVQLWWTHLTFGTKARDSKGRIYLAPNEKTRAHDSLHETAARLAMFGDVAVLGFAEQGALGGAWGVTWESRRHVPFRHKFSSSDYPKIPSFYSDDKHPVIFLNSCFVRYFLHNFYSTTREHRYRVWFMLATTLVHEVAHAYWMWISGGKDEPLWGAHEKTAELGFSWEAFIFGRVIMPYRSISTPELAQVLCSTQTHEWNQANPRDRSRPYDFAMDLPYDRQLKWTEIPTAQFMPSQAWRGNRWFIRDGARQDRDYVSVMRAIPMKWVFGWFSKDVWKQKRQLFWRKHTYRSPPLGPTFAIWYHRAARTGQVRLFYADGQRSDPYEEAVYSDVNNGMRLYDGDYYRGQT